MIYTMIDAKVDPKKYFICENNVYYGVCGKGKEKTVRIGAFALVTAFDYSDNISWEYKDDVMTLSGSGETVCRGNSGYDGRNEYYGAHPYFPQYVKSCTKTLIIQEGITSLDWILFYKFDILSEVHFPSSLLEIIISTYGDETDFGVKHLKKLRINKKLSEKFLKIVTADDIEYI